MLYKCLFISLLLFLTSPAVWSAPATDSLLNQLSKTIENNDTYIKEKYSRIRQLRQVVEAEELPLVNQFNIYNKLYFEYRTFQYDSAFIYAVKLQGIARKLKDPVRSTQAKLKLSFTLLSSGMYKEALDSLNAVHSRGMPDSIRIEYYALKARAFYDLNAYTQNAYYSPRYIRAGETYVDSALALLDENAIQFYELRAMKRVVAGQQELARADLETILEKFKPSLHQFAMTANSLGNIYYERKEVDKAIEMKARAAIADLKLSVKEGVALMTLADYLYHNGEENRAYTYIKQALADAEFYRANQRKIQVGSILPVIEGEQLATLEQQRRSLVIYSIVSTVLSLLVVTFAVIIFRQLRQLREAKSTVTQANEQLQVSNGKLTEANRIKEEYIGYSFKFNSEYLDKVEKFKQAIDKKLMARKYDEISHVMKSLNLKKEREALFLSFDKIFLQLFPNFVDEFNSYFKEEDKVRLKDKGALTIELRIFALIRLGIHDHEQIARILEYSVNTIYTYKTRVKNRSVLPNDEFESRIMAIKVF